MSRIHLALNSYEFERSLQFYEALFQTPPEKLADDYAKFSSSNPPVNLTLNRASAPVGAGSINHLGIEVESPEAVARAEARFEALRVATRPEKDTVCCYARQDKFWTNDPDGHAWEFFYVAEQLSVAPAPGGCC